MGRVLDGGAGVNLDAPQTSERRPPNDHDVRGFEIAMNDSCRMRFDQGDREFVEQDGGLTNREASCRPQPVREGPALDGSHREILDLAGITDVIDRANVRVPERGRRSGPAKKPMPRFGVLRVELGNLQRDLSVQARVMGTSRRCSSMQGDIARRPFRFEYRLNRLEPLDRRRRSNV